MLRRSLFWREDSNGRVFVGTATELDVCGFLPSPFCSQTADCPEIRWLEKRADVVASRTNTTSLSNRPWKRTQPPEFCLSSKSQSIYSTHNGVLLRQGPPAVHESPHLVFHSR